jgi:hypothetical protein
MARIFLAIVGAAYILLAAWWSGRSEFLTVYGGLELARGITFLRPQYFPADVHPQNFPRSDRMDHLCRSCHLFLEEATSVMDYVSRAWHFGQK